MFSKRFGNWGLRGLECKDQLGVIRNGVMIQLQITEPREELIGDQSKIDPGLPIPRGLGFNPRHPLKIESNINPTMLLHYWPDRQFVKLAIKVTNEDTGQGRPLGMLEHKVK